MFWRLRAIASFRVAQLYQLCWWAAEVPVLGELWMNFLWWLCKATWPEKSPGEDYIPASMVEAIRQRAKLPEDEFYEKLKKAQEDNEREQVGLPPKA